MKQIKKRKLKMRPKIYFVAGSLLLGIGLAGTTMLAIFFVNLVLFKLRIHRPFGFLILGRSGLRPFLLTFPWLSLLAALGGIIGGRALLKKYDISYKKSFWGLMIGLIALVLVLAFLLSRTGINEKMKRVPRLKRFYQSQLTDKEKQILREKIGKIREGRKQHERKKPL